MFRKRIKIWLAPKDSLVKKKKIKVKRGRLVRAVGRVRRRREVSMLWIRIWKLKSF